MGGSEGTRLTPAGRREVRHGPWKWLFAWSLAYADAAQHRAFGERKRALFARIEGRDGAPPVVVEVGAGSGLNARFLPAGTQWVVVEPNVHQHGRVRAAAAAHGLDLELHAAVAEALPVAGSAADAVVLTHVLCSVDDVGRALAEARRVLRPGGRLVFLEHVAAEPGSALRRMQRALRRPWGWLADGCVPDRETERAIRASGFASVEAERFSVPLGLAAPHVAGVATA